MSKYYAVAEGRNIGIFQNWNKVKSSVHGFSGAKYKSFKTLNEAQKYLLITPPDTVNNPLYDNNVNTVNNDNINNNNINNNNNDKLVVYTDGSCKDKYGGYGYLVIQNNFVSPICGKVPYYPCTNQISELYAIYMAIQSLIQSYKDDLIKTGVIIFTDSKYCIGCLTTWYYNWQNNGWINSKKESVKNQELIKNILNMSVGLKIKYEHVKAHNGHVYNEWVDKLANSGREETN